MLRVHSRLGKGRKFRNDQITSRSINSARLRALKSVFRRSYSRNREPTPGHVSVTGQARLVGENFIGRFSPRCLPIPVPHSCGERTLKMLGWAAFFSNAGQARAATPQLRYGITDLARRLRRINAKAAGRAGEDIGPILRLKRYPNRASIFQTRGIAGSPRGNALETGDFEHERYLGFPPSGPSRTPCDHQDPAFGDWSEWSKWSCSSPLGLCSSCPGMQGDVPRAREREAASGLCGLSRTPTSPPSNPRFHPMDGLSPRHPDAAEEAPLQLHRRSCR